jgi:hypothetical protein
VRTEVEELGRNKEGEQEGTGVETMGGYYFYYSMIDCR